MQAVEAPDPIIIDRSKLMLLLWSIGLVSVWLRQTLATSFTFLLVLMFVQSCLAIWSLRLGKRELVYMFSRAFIFLSCKRHFLSFYLPYGVGGGLLRTVIFVF